MERKVQLLEGIGSLIMNSQLNTYTYNPNKREIIQMLNYTNPSINQHIEATLNSITPKTNHYIHEVMLHNLA